MLRITRIDEGNIAHFKLEGKLAGNWVEPMEQSWRQVAPVPAGRSLVVDLTAVAFVNAIGTRLLTEMQRHGVGLRASSYPAESIAEEIKSRSVEAAKTEY